MKTCRSIALCIALPLLVLGVRLLLDARRELAVGDVPSLGRASRLWLPFGPSHEARRKLAALGREGMPGAWSELRASILATRWLATPDQGLLDEANHAIAVQRAGPDGDVAAELALLQNVHEPSRPLSVVALVGLFAFLYGAARALAGERRLALLGAAGFSLLVLGLAYA